MGVTSEVALDKVLMVPEKDTYTKQHWKNIYEVIDDGYFEQSDVMFPK